MQKHPEENWEVLIGMVAKTVSVEATIANPPNAADPYTSWDISVLDGMEKLKR